MLQQQPNQALPETIRVRALKGFYAHVDGRLSVVNPGDVVEVPQALAMELRHASKAVMTDADMKRQKAYLPERKKGGPKAPDLQTALAEGFAKLAALIDARLPAAPSTK